MRKIDQDGGNPGEPKSDAPGGALRFGHEPAAPLGGGSGGPGMGPNSGSLGDAGQADPTQFVLSGP